MRSVLVHLRKTTESDVAALLHQTYPIQSGPPWVEQIEGDACLYIEFYQDGPREHAAEEWAALVSSSGSEPAVSVIRDVSGRHPADDQVRQFVASMLTRFSGSAEDDYTPHLWSLEEIRSGHRVQGHAFFDYTGWCAEDHRET